MLYCTILLAGWLRETTLSYDAAFQTAGATVAFAAALLFIVKLLHNNQRSKYIIKTMVNEGEIEEAKSAISDEPDFLLSKDMYIDDDKIHQELNLPSLIRNEAKDQTLSYKSEDGKETDPENFYFQVDHLHWQKHFDVSKETSI